MESGLVKDCYLMLSSVKGLNRTGCFGLAVGREGAKGGFSGLFEKCFGRNGLFSLITPVGLILR